MAELTPDDYHQREVDILGDVIDGEGKSELLAAITQYDIASTRYQRTMAQCVAYLRDAGNTERPGDQFSATPEVNAFMAIALHLYDQETDREVAQSSLAAIVAQNSLTRSATLNQLVTDVPDSQVLAWSQETAENAIAGIMDATDTTEEFFVSLREWYTQDLFNDTECFAHIVDSSPTITRSIQDYNNSLRDTDQYEYSIEKSYFEHATDIAKIAVGTFTALTLHSIINRRRNP